MTPAFVYTVAEELKLDSRLYVGLPLETADQISCAVNGLPPISVLEVNKVHVIVILLLSELLVSIFKP